MPSTPEKSELSRRGFISASAAAAAAVALNPLCVRAEPDEKNFRLMFNTSTIMGQNIGIEKEVELVSKAGYDCIEPWIPKLNDYKKSGKTIKDLARRIKDANLTVESAIGFAQWIVNDDKRRAKGLDEAKRDMEMVLELGGKRIAAPPTGASGAKEDTVSAEQIADRYKALAEAGAKAGIVPMAEVWGHSKTFHTLNETIAAAMKSEHPKACILPDVFHLYKGGSSFDDLKKLTPANFQVLHVNDYPDIPPEKINDGHRVYPGDGIAPLSDVLKTLKALGFKGMLSLELFNQNYYKQDAALVVNTGMEKLKAMLKKAGV